MGDTGPTPFLESNAFLAAAEQDKEAVFACLEQMTSTERGDLWAAAHELIEYLVKFEQEGIGGKA